MALSSYLNIESENYWALMAIFIYYYIFIYYHIFIYHYNLYYYNYYIFIYYYNNIIDCILCVCWWGVDGNRGKPLRHLKVIPSSLQTYSVLFVIDWKSIGKHMPDLRHSRNIKIFGQEPYCQALSTLKGRFGGSQSYSYIIMYVLISEWV